MKQFFILLFYILTGSAVYPQYSSEGMDSIIAGIQLGGSDWLIAVSIEHAGALPIYDSLGNFLDEDPDGTGRQTKTVRMPETARCISYT